MTTKRTIARVERILRADMRWFVAQGNRIDMNIGPVFREGKWNAARGCGCVITATLVRRQPPAEGDKVVVAAKSLGVNLGFVNDLYYGATGWALTPGSPGDNLAQRLIAYGEKLNRKAKGKP